MHVDTHAHTGRDMQTAMHTHIKTTHACEQRHIYTRRNTRIMDTANTCRDLYTHAATQMDTQRFTCTQSHTHILYRGRNNKCIQTQR
jgi:hypothetical protein